VGLEAEVEEKGRITIPARIRKDLGIVKGEKLDISSKNGTIILKRKKIVGVSDIRGIIGRGKVKLQDIEDALGKEYFF
jgi:AbrB family looped-hinge helix DNA binding protein